MVLKKITAASIGLNPFFLKRQHFIYLFIYVFMYVWLRHEACRSLVPPDQGSNPCPLQGKCGVLTTGQARKVPGLNFLITKLGEL